MKITITSDGNLLIMSDYFMLESDSEYREFYLRVGNIDKQHLVIHHYELLFVNALYYLVGFNINFLPCFNKRFELCGSLFEVNSIKNNW